MQHPIPCLAWSEKLALRDEDLSPTDRADLTTHLLRCEACSAVQADYHFLDAQLRALPSPVIRLWLRLPLHSANADRAYLESDHPTTREKHHRLVWQGRRAGWRD
jgi:hypothetical protein